MPSNPPKIALVAATRTNRGFNWLAPIKGKIIRANGPNFCHVQRIKQFSHLIDVIVDGNQ